MVLLGMDRYLLLLFFNSFLFSSHHFIYSHQNFTDSITGDWGGKPYNDILLGLDYFLSASQWSSNLDASRVVGLGASYGGFFFFFLSRCC